MDNFHFDAGGKKNPVGFDPELNESLFPILSRVRHGDREIV